MNRTRRLGCPPVRTPGVCRLALLAVLALGGVACQTAPNGSPANATVLTDAQRRQLAERTVLNAATAPEPQLRLRAVEAMQYLGVDAAAQVTDAVGDPHPVVRYAAWVTAGRLQLTALAGPARAAAKDDEQPAYVRAAAAFAAAKIYAAAKADAPAEAAPPAAADSAADDITQDQSAADPDQASDPDPDPDPDADVPADADPSATPAPPADAGPADLSPLVGLLWSNDAGMRANAAVLLGDLGDGAARPMLRDAAQQPTPRASAVAQALLSLQISEALVKLGVDDQLNPIRLAAYSKDDEVRVLAVQMLGRLGDRTMEGAIMSFLTKDPQELRLAAAEALGDLGWPDGLTAGLQGAGSDLIRIRSQAALALGRTRLAIPAKDSPQNQQARDFARATLDRLLADPEASVRVAAAVALLEPPR